MVEISAAMVKELRDATNVSMMECKKALLAANGDKDEAFKRLREQGLAIAGKKASRAANSGLVAAGVTARADVGAMIEVNCETDFVARNDNFKAFVAALLEKAKEVEDGALAETMKAEVVAKIAEIGENIIVRRNLRYALQGRGLVGTYIHLGGKIGVMVELGCGKDETVSAEAFQNLAKDLTLHIAACNPQCLDRTAVAAGVLEAEKAIYAKQVEGKPANIVEKIVAGKIEKFFSQICLVEQAFVKNPDQTVTQLLAEVGKAAGDTLSIRRYARFQLGE